MLVTTFYNHQQYLLPSSDGETGQDVLCMKMGNKGFYPAGDIEATLNHKICRENYFTNKSLSKIYF